MADEKISDCPERVAYDLSIWIARAESKSQTRQYVLDLYSECLARVQGFSSDDDETEEE